MFKRSPKAFTMAVVMHLVLVFFLVVGVDWLVEPEVHRPKVDVVQARVIDEKRISAEAARLKQEQEKIKKREQAKKARAEKELADLKKKNQQEQQRLKQVEQKRKTAERKRLKAEKARKAEEKKKQQAEAKRKKLEAEAKKRKAAKKKAEAEKRRKAEAERKRKAEEARKRREAELKKALEAEQNDRAVNAYANVVGLRIERNWIRPLGSDHGLRCKLKVRFSSRGTVLAVQIVQGSGNTAFDRSAEAAVYKSDPLPAPPGGLREINFTFHPDA